MSKQVAFKNPFDLMEEEQDSPLSTPSGITQASNKKIINPLPFAKYQAQEQSKKIEMVSENSRKEAFASPFGDNLSENNQIQTNITKTNQQRVFELDENGDPPLLEDLGIEPHKIKQRILVVLKAGTPSQEIVEDPDLSGPILVALLFGILLMLSGKIHFGDIYAMFILGNFLLYILLNLMSQSKIIPFYSIMSTMGYSLLPICLLGLCGIFVNLKGSVGIMLGLVLAVWASKAAGNYMDILIEDQKGRTTLVVYPLFLFYLSFCMIVVF